MEKKDYILLIVYINVILYATCFQIQRPLEPFLVASLASNDSNDEYARLQSFFSIMQTIGSLYSGYLLDKIGAKAGFIITFIASAASYYLLSQSTSMNILYISKIPTIMQAGFLCAQLYVSQLTTNGQDRLKALGRLTMSYTIGSTIGPAVGGYLGASGDYFFGAKIAVVGSLLSVVLTFALPDVITPIKSKTDHELTSSKSLGMWKVFTIVWLFLLTKVITSVANSIGSSTMPLILKNMYHMDEMNLGFIMSFMSALNAITNGFFLAPISMLFGGDLFSVVEGCLLSLTCFLGIQTIITLPVITSMSFKNGIVEYTLLILALPILQYLLSTSITSEATSKVGPYSKGTLLGLEHSLFAAARILTPQIGVSLLKQGGVSLMSGVCCGIYLLVVVIWKGFSHKFHTSPNTSEDYDDAKLNNDEERKDR